MQPKRIQVERSGRRAPKGVIASTYDTLTSPDNAAVVRSVALFGVRYTIYNKLGNPIANT